VVPTPEPAPATGRHVIVAIGIDRYRHWRPLNNAVSDVVGAMTLFQRLGFEPVVPPLLDDHATGRAIDALVSDELTELHPSDSLIVFYAGHGGARTQRVAGRDVRTGYLVPVDGTNEPNRVKSWIELEPWLRRIAKLPPRHILVILDACFSGIALSSAIKWGRDSDALLDLPFATANARTSRLVITSALDDERALDSGPAPGHSLFTGCLIEALTGGVRPVGMRAGRPVIVGSEIGRYVRHRVQTYEGRPGWRQTPDHGTFDFDERGEMLIPVLLGDVTALSPPELARGSADRIAARPAAAAPPASVLAVEAAAIEGMALDAAPVETAASEAVAIPAAPGAERAAQPAAADTAQTAGSVPELQVAATEPMIALELEADRPALQVAATEPMIALELEADRPAEPAAPRSWGRVRRAWLASGAIAVAGTALAIAGRGRGDPGDPAPHRSPPPAALEIDGRGAAPEPAVPAGWSVDEHAGPPRAAPRPGGPAIATAASGSPGASPAASPVASPDCPLTIRSPAGTEVWWNGVSAIIPTTLFLPCGVEVTLRFHAPNHVDRTKQVIAIPGSKPLNLRLRRQPDVTSTAAPAPAVPAQSR
jgi:hypothetical protein